MKWAMPRAISAAGAGPLLAGRVPFCGVALGLLVLAERIQTGTKVSAGTCPPVQNTPRFTIVYGTVTLDGVPALRVP